MGEINFLASNTSNAGNNKDGKKKQEKKEELKWTRTKTNDNEKTRGVFGLKKNKDTKQDKDTDNSKQRIEKSRQEVLEMIDNNKKTKEDKETKLPRKELIKHEVKVGAPDQEDKPSEKTKAVPAKSSSWLSRVFANHNKSNKNEKKNEKIASSKETKDTGSKKLDKKSRDLMSASTAKSGERKVGEDNPLVFNSNSWNSSSVLETNLIDKNEFGFFDSEKKFKYIIISILGALSMVGFLYLGLLFWEHKELDKLKIEKREIANLEIKVKQLEKGIDEAKVFQEKLSTASALLDKHVYWTNFFNFLEEATLTNTYYKGDLEINIDEELTLLTRSPDYASLKNQLIVFANDQRVTSIKREDDTRLYEEIVEEDSVAMDNLDLVSDQARATSTEPVIEKGIETSLLLEINNELLFKKNIATSSLDNNIY